MFADWDEAVTEAETAANKLSTGAMDVLTLRNEDRLGYVRVLEALKPTGVGLELAVQADGAVARAAARGNRAKRVFMMGGNMAGRGADSSRAIIVVICDRASLGVALAQPLAGEVAGLVQAQPRLLSRDRRHTGESPCGGLLSHGTRGKHSS